MQTAHTSNKCVLLRHAGLKKGILAYVLRFHNMEAVAETAADCHHVPELETHAEQLSIAQHSCCEVWDELLIFTKFMPS